MRRKEREITDPRLIDEIIRSSTVCRLGLAKDNQPYLVPVSFGYDGHAIYFHSAREGKKIDYLMSNAAVCFEFEHDVRVLPSEDGPCRSTVSYQSVIGYGTATELVEPDDRMEGLNQIVLHYSGRRWPFSEDDLKNTRIWKITVQHLTGKQSKDRGRT